MRKAIAFLLLLLCVATGCRSIRIKVLSQGRVDDLEASIHRQFYKAFQELNMEQGITVIPLNLSVKFDHTYTNTGSAGLTAFSFLQLNYTHQNINDNSVSDILAPTKLTSANPSTGYIGAKIEHVGHYAILPRTSCAFLDSVGLQSEEYSSVDKLRDQIEKAVSSFVNTANFGPLNDHQITLDIKFSIQNGGYVNFTPGFSVLGADFAKMSLELERQATRTNEVQFTFDVLQGDPISGYNNKEYYHLRDSLIKAKPGGICAYFPDQDYTDTGKIRILNTPPIADQRGFSACVAYSVCYTTLSTMLKKGSGGFDSSNEYSPDFIYARMTDKGCSGLQLPPVLDFIVANGDCTTDDVPIQDTASCKKYDLAMKKEVRASIEKAWALKDQLKLGWVPLDPNDIDQVRLCLENYEPVIAAFYVSSSFIDMWNYPSPLYPGKNVWKSLSGPYTDSHCVAIIGYDNTMRMFKVQNSWGKSNSAKDGFFWVTYDLVQRGCFSEAYSFVRNPDLTPK